MRKILYEERKRYILYIYIYTIYPKRKKESTKIILLTLKTLKIMAKNQRFFQDGLNQVNGYVVDVVRFVSAQQVTTTSRIAARHWGTITTPSGEVIDMGESGMTTPQIKKIVGGETRQYNRGGQSSAIKQLEKLKSSLESLGMDTTEVDAKIEAEKARIEEEKNRIDNSAEIKRLEREIKKLEKIKEQLASLGMCTIAIDEKLGGLAMQVVDLQS